MPTMQLTRIAALFCVACVGCSKQAPDSATPSAGGATAAVCRDLTAGLESIQMVSQGSHALARHDLTVNVATRELSGQSYTLSDSDSTPRPQPVKRAVTAEENDTLLGSLKTICQPIQPTSDRDPTAAGGGYTVFIVSYTGASPRRLVLAADAQSAAQHGEHYVQLTREERSAIVNSWPAAAPAPPAQPMQAIGD